MAAVGQVQVFVPSSLLPKLICTKCKNYLSHFPIYSHPKIGSMCGRCSVDIHENFIRNEIYETTVQFQKFPCRYRANGCLENLIPANVPDHERLCLYKKYECPTRVYNNCIWEGFCNEILEHFENKHPTFILKDGKFEVDFINNHKENYLLPYGEELFIVTREAVSASSTFSCSVEYVGSNPEIEHYTYIFTLESGNRLHKHIVKEVKMKSILEFNDLLLKDVLQDPTNIIAHIDLVPNENDEFLDSISGAEANNVNSQLDYDQLSELECPVCFEYLVPPIFQCETGHSICERCRNTQNECPTCKQSFKRTQNFTLEKLIRNMIYPCKHDRCTFSTKAQDIKVHEASCIFGPYRCPVGEYEECKDEMSVIDMYDHIFKKHYESLLEIEMVSIPFDEDSTLLNECYILKHSLRLFRLCFRFISNYFYWVVQLIGPPEECVKYKFELEIIDNSNENCRIYFKKVCAPFCAANDAFSDDKSDTCVSLEKNQLSKFISNQLTYRVRILNY